MLRLLPTLIAIPVALAFVVPSAGAREVDPTYCGKVKPPHGPKLTLDVIGPSCKTGRSVIRRYYSAVKAGRCGGTACIVRIGRYSCSTASVREQKREGISTDCYLVGKPNYRVFTR